MDADEFCAHIDHINAAGYTSLLMSLGYELGLFDLMMKENRSVTSQELADLANMKERYVREWLLGASAGKMISYDTDKKAFYIPEGHHDALRGYSSNSGAIPVLATRTPDVKKCFMKDGPYGIDSDHDAYFWQWLSGWRAYTAKDFIGGDLVPNLKKADLYDKLESGITVMDVCCGSAELTLELSKGFPKSKFVGVELFEKPLAVARQRIASSKLDNCSVIQGDALNLPDDMEGKYDMAIIIDSLHDLPDPYKALAATYKALAPGGYFVIYDSGTSTKVEDNVGDMNASMLYTWSIYNCMASSMTEEPRIGYGTCWGRENIEEAIRRHFQLEQVIELPCLYCLYICKKA